MKGLSYIWRMALRRKAACLLVVVSTVVATVFMLFYPSLIENTEQQLDETYKGITVTGSIITTKESLTPAINRSLWQELQDSGWFSKLYSKSYFRVQILEKDVLESLTGEEPTAQEKLMAFQDGMIRFERDYQGKGGVRGRMTAYNCFEAMEELVRIRENINWMEGYDESCIESNERVCIVPESWGYEPGDTIPLLAEYISGMSYIEGIFHLKVVATYPGKITGFTCAMPLKTMEELTNVASKAQKQVGNHYSWTFSLEEVYFTVKDNQQLDAIKAMMEERGVRDSEFLRLRIDDRILKETVNPIKSNLAQLEGSYLFFFVIIAAIGFFISFLLARGRKAEYAVMRLLGENRTQITLKALLEQFVLCLSGVILGSLIALNSFDALICSIILLCYTVGAALAVLLTVRVNVMDILRDKE